MGGVSTIELHDARLLARDVFSSTEHVFEVKRFHAADGAAVPDAAWAMPGYLDAHRHLPHGFRAEAFGDRIAERTAAYGQVVLEGVDTVFDMGVSPPMPWRDRPDAVSSAVCGIDGPTGLPATSLAVVARTADECRRLVGTAVDDGAGFIKLFASGTGKFDEAVATRQKMDDVLIAATVDEARRHGLRTVAHCMGGPALRACLESGVASIEHGLYCTLQELRLCADHGVQITLTLGVYYVQHRREILGRLCELVDNVRRSGIEFSIGTDGHGRTMQDEVVLLAALGMPLSESLRKCIVSPTRATVYNFYRANPLSKPANVLEPIGVGVGCSIVR